MRTNVIFVMSYYLAECRKLLLKRTDQTRSRITLNRHGFTLVELVAVCAIIGTLAAIAIPTFSELKTKARVSQGIADIRNMEKDIIAYATEKGNFPPNLAAIQRNNLLDPWHKPYVYVLGGGGYFDWVSAPLNDDFDLYSMGKDGVSSGNLSDAEPNTSSDDIIRGGNGTEVALARDY